MSVARTPPEVCLWRVTPGFACQRHPGCYSTPTSSFSVILAAAIFTAVRNFAARLGAHHDNGLNDDQMKNFFPPYAKTVRLESRFIGSVVTSASVKTSSSSPDYQWQLNAGRSWILDPGAAQSSEENRAQSGDQPVKANDGETEPLWPDERSCSCL